MKKTVLFAIPCQIRKYALAALLVLHLGFFGCENNPGDEEPPAVVTDLAKIEVLSVGVTDISPFLEWAWRKQEKDSEYSFTWFFQPDGAIATMHCCGALFPSQFSYLFYGDVLVTYGSEMEADELEVTRCTMSTDGGTLYLDNGTCYIRGYRMYPHSLGLKMKLSNDLLGTWYREDGVEYVFGSDAGLRINSRHYGYMVKNSELLIIGFPVEGASTILQKYTFSRTGNTLTLTSNGENITLSLAE
jgi:hypothetical protein